MRDRSAFTLIELLVCVAIVGVLMSLLAPALARSMEQARRAVCMTHLRTLYVATQSYQTTYKTLPVCGGFPDLSRGWDSFPVALEGFVDAKPPSLRPDGTVATGVPWRCPSDMWLAQASGCSYHYPIGPRQWGAPPPFDPLALVRAYSNYAGYGPHLLVLYLDKSLIGFERWTIHPEPYGVNAVYLDGHAAPARTLFTNPE